MSKLCLSILIVLCNSLVSFAGEIKGVVYNQAGERMEYVTIQVKGTNKGETTDDQGRFSIHNIKKGYYTLVFSSVSYANKELNVSLTTDNSVVI